MQPPVVPATPVQALSESAAAEARNAELVAAEAKAKERSAELALAAETAIDLFIKRVGEGKPGVIFNEIQRAEIKNIVHEALAEFFKSYSSWGRSILVGTATVIGSIVAIAAGVKIMLVWFGFVYKG